MNEPVDVEIYLIPRNMALAAYEVQLRVLAPDELTSGPPVRADVTINPESFVELALDADPYGRALFNALLPAGTVRERFLTAIDPVAHGGAGVRVRLLIDASAAHLHALRWETLRTPDGEWLLADASFYFSRYLTAAHITPIKPARAGTLSALIAIASPQDANYPDLKPVDVAAERARADKALELPTVVLDGSTPDRRATLDRLMTELDEGHDVLYLVCHGGVGDRGAQIWLEDESGAAQVVTGAELADRIHTMRRPPRLIVLASCQSGGDGQPLTTSDEGALAALGPLLAAAGTPAVVAMNGDVEMQTIDRFMPKFFHELQVSKSPDRAVAAARWLVRDAIDSDMPVLFSRLRDGRLWYQPSFGGSVDLGWGDLVNAVVAKDCLPIVGPGLLEPILGDAIEMGERWATDAGYPRHGERRLSDVAQFIASAESVIYLIELLYRDWSAAAFRLGKAAKKELADLGEPPTPMTSAFLSSIISTVGRRQRAAVDDDVYGVLSRIKVPLYITTTPDNLLADALLEANRTPHVEVLRWNSRELPWSSCFDNDRFQATLDRPVVYHLFGHLDRPSSLVLTEDDHFDYLMHMGSARLPAAVRSALVSRPLLFLGFGVDDWRFRVLYRSVVNEERRRRDPGLSRRSVAVQLEPDHNVDEPRRLRRALEQYFEGARVQTYWGTASDFAGDLVANLKKKGHVL